MILADLLVTTSQRSTVECKRRFRNNMQAIISQRTFVGTHTGIKTGASFNFSVAFCQTFCVGIATTSIVTFWGFRVACVLRRASRIVVDRKLCRAHYRLHCRALCWDTFHRHSFGHGLHNHHAHELTTIHSFRRLRGRSQVSWCRRDSTRVQQR
jgi:hypothetical protein